MPNKSDTIITELDDQAIGAGPTYSYSALTIESTRSHAAQVQVLFYYDTLGDGTAVSDVEFANWYTPFVLPSVTENGDVILTFDNTTRTVTIGDTTRVTVQSIGGTSYNLPAFNTGTKVRILRSQNVTNKATTFYGGSRITATGLNNAVDQVFDSVQELDTRVSNLEGANFEQGIVLNLADIPVISVEKGGTGATTASGARTALGTHDASNLTTGTISNDRLSNVPVSKLAGTLADDQLVSSNVTQFTADIAAGISLDDINDVTATIVSDDSVLSYDFGTSKWVAGPLIASQIPTLTLSKISDAGTAAASDTGDFEASGSVATHAAVTSGVHGISVFGATLIDDADASAARTTLGAAATSHTHTLSDITDAGTAAASNTGDFEASGSVSTHAAVTLGVHGISAFGATLVDDSDAATARTTLGLGTAATSNTGDFEAAGVVATHAAITNGVHGISTFGASLVDDVDASTARTTLGLGTAATLNTADFAAATHTHDAADITSGTLDAARLPTITDSYAMFVETVSDKISPGYVVDAKVATNRTITGFYAKTESGTCTATLRNITDNVEIGSISVTSAGGSDATLINTSVTTGERIGVVVSSNASATDLQIVVEYTF